MLTAYANAMGRYATFRGRSSRSQFWLYNLAVLLLFVVCLIVDTAVLGFDPDKVLPVTGIFNLVHLVPSLAVTVRRLHDTDRSGWMLLIGLIPLIGQIVLFVFACQASTPGANPYGAEPGRGDDTDAFENTHPRAAQGPLRASQQAGGGRRDVVFADPTFGDPAPAQRPASAPGGAIAAPTSNLAAELRELADLKAQGVLDEAEFQHLKAEALTRRSGGG